TAGLKLAYESFERARQDAGQQPRLRAEALGGLAQLYEDQKRDGEALRLNLQAIQSAQSIKAHDLLLELEWRQGRLHRALNQLPEALVAYQHAVEHIEAIRQDIPVEYQGGRSSFRETLEPVYLGLADLLLEQARQQSGEKKTHLLRRARETAELIKQSELDDFLGERCTVQSVKTALLESVEPRTAILYPIILPDRLELLVSTGSDVQQSTQPVSDETIQSTTHSLAKALRTGRGDVQSISRQLYDWLIKPVEPWLHERQVQTLVVVPDGVLRLIPLAALYDGERYLIERYALATSPGLTLFEPSPLSQHGIKSLLAGMSDPGPVVEHLPPAFLRAMARASARGADIEEPPGSRALPISEVDTTLILDQTRSIDLDRLMKEPVFRQKLKERLRLPGVAQELASMRQLIPNTLLMNEGFTVDSFKQRVVQQPYSVVHIASHGVFGRTADTSFIMAYDGVINIDELDRLLKSEKFKKEPLELLTLSACQTAEGDDRAPLGLSGIALKAKVRSALGTLWPVSDLAAARLMPEFYKALLQPGITKVEALRQAQLELLKDKQLEHPYFWSPFIPVGNWL
ncbi:MAG TPA: CHAT domain-containing protein, partial [Aggregatilineaceae bacterium]|nr:CHAT domain-containing protein [Aggregatilineaceae bacterium]